MATSPSPWAPAPVTLPLFTGFVHSLAAFSGPFIWTPLGQSLPRWSIPPQLIHGQKGSPDVGHYSLVSSLTPSVVILSQDPSLLSSSLSTTQPQRLSWVSAPGPKCTRLQAKCLTFCSLATCSSSSSLLAHSFSTYGQDQEFYLQVLDMSRRPSSLSPGNVGSRYCN